MCMKVLSLAVRSSGVGHHVASSGGKVSATIGSFGHEGKEDAKSTCLCLPHARNSNIVAASVTSRSLGSLDRDALFVEPSPVREPDVGAVSSPGSSRRGT
jgi:hypothetical protein